MIKELQGDILAQKVKTWVFFRSVNKAHTKKTVQNYTNSMNRFLNYLNGKSLNLQSVEDYQYKLSTVGVNNKRWKASSINADIKVIKQFIKYLYKKELIIKDFSHDIELQKEREVDLEIPDLHILKKIIYTGTEPNKSKIGIRGDNCLNVQRKTNSRDALLFMLSTGWRLIEIKRLRQEDLYLNNETPSVRINQKGGDQKIVTIPNEAARILRTIKNRNYIFPVTDSHLNHCLKRGCEKLKIKLRTPLTVHSLRRAFGTNLSNNGANHFLVQKALRHKSITTTQRYIKPSDNQLSRIINNYHDLNREAIEYKDKEQYYLNSLLSMGIDKDERVIFSYERNDKNELIIKLCERR